MKILFEDKDIVVCIKPHGVISQSSPDGKDMINLLMTQLNCDIFPVHRLDRETGGVMVYAKNSKSAAKLCSDVSNRKINKEYMAVVHNNFPYEKGELRDLLFRDKNRNKSYVVKRIRKGVKEAVLNFEKIGNAVTQFGELTLLKIALVTGRTHQIRVQFTSRGYPLLGDKRYGAKDNFDNLALCSYKLKLNHPTTGEKMIFSSEPELDIFTIFEE